MRPELSEFSYGFAVTRELVENLPGNKGVAPFFPSLVSEANLGYDLEIPTGTLFGPLYLQFKLSDVLVSNGGYEQNKTGFTLTPPYCRFYISKSQSARQHRKLTSLEGLGAQVFYIAPCFYELREFNNCYETGTVIHNSRMFTPTQIGQPLSYEHHSVAFKSRGSSYRCSEVTNIGEPLVFPDAISLDLKGTHEYTVPGTAKFVQDISERLEINPSQIRRSIAFQAGASEREAAAKNLSLAAELVAKETGATTFYTWNKS